MANLQDKWHDNWLVDTLLRVGFITILAWIGIILAVYFGSAGESISVFMCEPLPEGESAPTPANE
jgi:hypothetical protein